MASAPEPSEIRDHLWTLEEHLSPSPTSDRLLEQYKVYVEMADRISARRASTNTFFLTLNTAVFALVGALSAKDLRGDPLILIPVLALLVQCGAWLFLLRSYRQLNAAKYAVIGAMEERLPASPYYRGEWRALGEGRDRRRYWPLSHLEQWTPIAFAVLYAIAGLALALG
jgi:hypothetical protein